MGLALPTHIAIIMDGNGRWANARGYHRTRGHREGANRVDDIVTACVERGVQFLTLYAFSTENWNRPSAEVSILMRLLTHHLKTMDKKLIKNNVSLLAQGTLHRLPKHVQKELRRVIDATAQPKPKMYLNLCLSYGGRQEITDAARRLAEKVKAGELEPDELTEEHVREALYFPNIPDPDLMIRTGGEYRISNFLLWQLAYSELYTTEVLWPDFREKALDDAIETYSGRQRRFGLTGAQVKPKSGELRPS